MRYGSHAIKRGFTVYCEIKLPTAASCMDNSSITNFYVYSAAGHRIRRSYEENIFVRQ